MRVHLPSVREQIAASATLWRRSLALVFAAAPRTALAVGVLMAVQAVLPLGTLWASRGVVDAAARVRQRGQRAGRWLAAGGVDRPRRGVDRRPTGRGAALPGSAGGDE
jgi:hypothetical protein